MLASSELCMAPKSWILCLLLVLQLMYECGFSGILADEMGLGKTIQCISLICHLIAQRVCGPFLICAPLSAIATWVNELKQFAPKVVIPSMYNIGERILYE
jgi:SNF2 family DNA or RNA helicase